MSKARLIKRKDALAEEERKDALAQEEKPTKPVRTTIGEGAVFSLTKVISEYRKAKKLNPRQAFFDLFQQQHSE